MRQVFGGVTVRENKVSTLWCPNDIILVASDEEEMLDRTNPAN